MLKSCHYLASLETAEDWISFKSSIYGISLPEYSFKIWRLEVFFNISNTEESQHLHLIHNFEIYEISERCLKKRIIYRPKFCDSIFPSDLDYAGHFNSFRKTDPFRSPLNTSALTNAICLNRCIQGPAKLRPISYVKIQERKKSIQYLGADLKILKIKLRKT